MMRRLLIGKGLTTARIALLLLVCSATQANADTGPYIWHLPFAGFILVAVIVLEALVAHAVISTSWGASVRVAGVANIASALVGIGIATLLGMLMVELERDSLLDQSSRNGVPSIALMAMFVCFPFFLSVLVEYFVARAILRHTAKRLVRNWAWAANLVSYGGLWLILLVRVLA